MTQAEMRQVVAIGLRLARGRTSDPRKLFSLGMGYLRAQRRPPPARVERFKDRPRPESLDMGRPPIDMRAQTAPLKFYPAQKPDMADILGKTMARGFKEAAGGIAEGILPGVGEAVVAIIDRALTGAFAPGISGGITKEQAAFIYAGSTIAEQQMRLAGQEQRLGTKQSLGADGLYFERGAYARDDG